jgi:hypothetical protein
MIRGMRIANVVLALLVLLGSTTMLVEHLDDWARTLGGLFGIALWGAPFYLAWRGLAPDSTLRMVRRARIANLVVGGLWILFAVVIVIILGKANPGNYVFLVLMLLFFGIPVALNLKALGKRKAELDQTKTVQAGEHVDAHLAPAVAAVVSTVAVSSPPSAPPPSSNYFARHWRGDLSLAASFWINTALFANGISVLLFVSVDSFGDEWPLRNVAFAFVAVLIFSLAAWVWGVFGVWRSSEKHVLRGGLPVFAGLAKVMVVLGVISTAGQLGTTYLPMFQNFVPLMFGHDPMGEYQVTVLADGRSILVRGMLREGSAKGIEKIINAAPAVTTLMLNSNGGRLAEGKHLAEFVHGRGLNTYVEDVCLSACTFVFLAGKERAATPNAKIGFHLPVVPWSSSKADDGSEYLVNVYRRAGLPDEFIQRVRGTPSSTMWYPTRDELIEARVITRVSLGGETAASFTKYRSEQELALAMRSISLLALIEKRFPEVFREAINRAWLAKESGGNDSQIIGAARSSLTSVWGTLRLQADDASLERLAILAIEQRKAARALSYEACTLLIANQLDTFGTLPKEITEKEMAWKMEALASEPRAGSRPQSDLVTRSIREAVSRMPPQLIEVVANPERFANEPKLMCDADIALLEKALSLPPTLRAAALDGLLRR